MESTYNLGLAPLVLFLKLGRIFEGGFSFTPQAFGIGIEFLNGVGGLVWLVDDEVGRRDRDRTYGTLAHTCFSSH